MLDATKVAALKTLGFSDADITGLQAQAAATEKSADAQQVAYKADEPRVEGLNPGNASGEFADLVINGITYKAFPPSPPTAADAVVEENAIEDMPMEEEAPAEGGLTLSPEDIAAIGSAVAEQIGPAIAQVMGALDLEKKVAGHVQGLLAPYQATKDATDAAKAEQIAALQTALKDTQSKLNELLGLQPEVAPRASESATTAINPWVPTDQQLMQAVKDQVSPNDQFAFGDLVQNLFGNQAPGQA